MRRLRVILVLMVCLLCPAVAGCAAAAIGLATAGAAQAVERAANNAKAKERLRNETKLIFEKGPIIDG